MSTLFDDFHSEDFNGFVDDSVYEHADGDESEVSVSPRVGGSLTKGTRGSAYQNAIASGNIEKAMTMRGGYVRDKAAPPMKPILSSPLVKDLKQAKVETAIIKEQAKAVKEEAKAREAVAKAEKAEAVAEIAKTKTIEAKVQANENIVKSDTNATPLDVKAKIDDTKKTEVVVEQKSDDSTKKILAIAGIGLIVFLLWKNEAFS